jgi:GNAT superfamily N-acetyltransferase
MDFTLTAATIDQIPDIEALIAESVRGLGQSYYSADQIEGALKTAWGVDTQLILDGTYFVVHDGNMLVACGGWSFRETLFGNDSVTDRDDSMIDPGNGAAKIRAFFVKPIYARRGLGSTLMRRCEEEAVKKRYKRLELMATLPGQRLYERFGFVADSPIDYPLSDKLSIQFVPMKKDTLCE